MPLSSPACASVIGSKGRPIRRRLPCLPLNLLMVPTVLTPPTLQALSVGLQSRPRNQCPHLFLLELTSRFVFPASPHSVRSPFPRSIIPDFGSFFPTWAQRLAQSEPHNGKTPRVLRPPHTCARLRAASPPGLIHRDVPRYYLTRAGVESTHTSHCLEETTHTIAIQQTHPHARFSSTSSSATEPLARVIAILVLRI